MEGAVMVRQTAGQVGEQRRLRRRVDGDEEIMVGTQEIKVVWHRGGGSSITRQSSNIYGRIYGRRGFLARSFHR